jgi:hypothetical protein
MVNNYIAPFTLGQMNIIIPRPKITPMARQKVKPEIVQCNHAHDNNNQKDLINYLHAACFSPVKSTWIKAIKNGIVSSWPGLNEHNVEKYLSKSTSTAKGHLNQQRQNARTTKIKDAELLDSENDQDHGIKT